MTNKKDNKKDSGLGQKKNEPADSAIYIGKDYPNSFLTGGFTGLAGTVDIYKKTAYFDSSIIDRTSSLIGYDREKYPQIGTTGFGTASSYPYLTNQENFILPTIAPTYNSPTKEEIEKIVERKLSTKKDETFGKDQIVGLVEEIMQNRNKKEDDSILEVNKKGLNLITKELLDTKTVSWHCAKCRAPLDTFEGEESIEKIKKYLIGFKNNIFKSCKNGHQNWFEIKEDGIIWMTKVIFERIFDNKKN